MGEARDCVPSAPGLDGRASEFEAETEVRGTLREVCDFGLRRVREHLLADLQPFQAVRNDPITTSRIASGIAVQGTAAAM